MSYYFHQKYEKPRKKVGNETVTVTSYWELIRDNTHIILARQQPVVALSSIIVLIMPARCVVGSCSNVPNAEQGIALHFMPFIDDERPEAKRRRRQWIRFVNVKRAKWNPTKYSGICSLCKRRFYKKICTNGLIVDEVGVVPIPRFYERAEDKPVSTIHKRKVSILIICS